MYFKLGNKVYKSSNTMTIGRGEPFKHISEDRSVSRSHCRLSFKRGKFYIQDLKTNTGVFVQGIRIKSGYRTEVSPKSEIQIGSQELILLETYEGDDFEEISYFNSSVASLYTLSYFSIFLLVSLGSYGLFYWLLTSSFGESAISLFDLSTFFASITIGFILTAIIYTANVLKLNHARLFMNEVILGVDYLILHFQERRIILKYKDIQHFKKRIIYTQNVHYNLNFIKNFSKLKSNLLKKIPKEARNSLPKERYKVKRVLFLFCFFFIWFISKLLIETYATQWGRSELYAPAAFISFSICLLLFDKNTLRKRLNAYTKIQKRNLAIIVPLFSLYLICEDVYNYNQKSQQGKMLTSCTSKNRESCKKLDLNIIDEIIKDNNFSRIKVTKAICKIDSKTCELIQKHNDTFHKSSEREIASEKK